MKLFVLIFLLVLLPASAFAQPTYDLSCKNVSRIRIGRLDETSWNVESYNGHFHIVLFELKPDAAKALVGLRDTAPKVTITYRGEDWTKESLSITANGSPLRDDAPTMSGLGDQSITITITREEDTFDTARSVCPALVPRKVIVDWERDWEPGWERREYK